MDWEEVYKDMANHFNCFMKYTGDTKDQWIKRIDSSFRSVLEYVEKFYREQGIPEEVRDML